MPLVQRRLLIFALSYNDIIVWPASSLHVSTLRAEVQPTLCVCLGNLSWTQPSTSGSPWVPSLPPATRLPLTFCLSIQVPRHAWRIACGMACSLLFPAWVVTNTQSWHSESCGSHSPGRDPRAGRAREKKQPRFCSHWCSAGGPEKGRVVQGCGWQGRGWERVTGRGWGGRLTWARAVLGGAPEDNAADQLGQHAA